MSLTLVLTVSVLAAPLDLPAWNQERLQTQRVGLGVLGGWAVANMAVGAIGAATATDEQARWVHLGNLLWNTVNLGLSVVGLATGWNANPASFDAKQSLRESSTAGTVYAINAGVDLAYLATAAFLWQRGASTNDLRLVGMGQALLIQGGFLLVFDVVMAVLHAVLTTKLLDGVSITPTP